MYKAPRTGEASSTQHVPADVKAGLRSCVTPSPQRQARADYSPCRLGWDNASQMEATAERQRTPITLLPVATLNKSVKRDANVQSGSAPLLRKVSSASGSVPRSIVVPALAQALSSLCELLLDPAEAVSIAVRDVLLYISQSNVFREL